MQCYRIRKKIDPMKGYKNFFYSSSSSITQIDSTLRQSTTFAFKVVENNHYNVKKI